LDDEEESSTPKTIQPSAAVDPISTLDDEESAVDPISTLDDKEESSQISTFDVNSVAAKIQQVAQISTLDDEEESSTPKTIQPSAAVDPISTLDDEESAVDPISTLDDEEESSKTLLLAVAPPNIQPKIQQIAQISHTIMPTITTECLLLLNEKKHPHVDEGFYSTKKKVRVEEEFTQKSPQEILSSSLFLNTTIEPFEDNSSSAIISKEVSDETLLLSNEYWNINSIDNESQNDMNRVLNNDSSIKFIWLNGYKTKTFSQWYNFSDEIELSVEDDLKNISVDITSKTNYSIDTWVRTKHSSFDLWYNFLTMFWVNNTCKREKFILDQVQFLRIIATAILRCFLKIKVNNEQCNLYPLNTQKKFNLYHILYISKYRYNVDNKLPFNINLLGLICFNDSTYVLSYDGSKILKNKISIVQREKNNNNKETLLNLVRDNNGNDKFSIGDIDTLLNLRSSLRIQDQRKQLITAPITSSPSFSAKKRKRKNVKRSRRFKISDEEEEEEEEDEEEEEKEEKKEKKKIEEKKEEAVVETAALEAAALKAEALEATAIEAAAVKAALEAVVDAAALKAAAVEAAALKATAIVAAAVKAAALADAAAVEAAAVEAATVEATAETLIYYENQFKTNIIELNSSFKSVSSIIEWSATENDYTPKSVSGRNPRLNGRLNSDQKEQIEIFKTIYKTAGNSSIYKKDPVEFKDFSSLRIGNWITGDLVCAYTILLNNLEYALRKLDLNRKKIKYLDQLFLYNLETHQFSETKCIKLFDKYKLSTFDTIFMFANQDNKHWVLYKIVIAEKKVYLYDSLSRSYVDKEQLDNVLKFLEINNKNCSLTWKSFIDRQNPNQNNGNDCGVYMLISGYFLSEFDRSDSYRAIDCKSMARIKIGLDLFEGKINDFRIKSNIADDVVEIFDDYDENLGEELETNNDEGEILIESIPVLKNRLSEEKKEKQKLQKENSKLKKEFNDLKLKYQALKEGLNNI
jgi:hypothetical protein